MHPQSPLLDFGRRGANPQWAVNAGQKVLRESAKSVPQRFRLRGCRASSGAAQGHPQREVDTSRLIGSPKARFFVLSVDRKRVMNDIIPFLEKAFTGEPFEWKGRTIRVTPKPVQQPRPPIFMGGASKAAARRAAHFADAFLPTMPALYEVYLEELAKLGKPAPPTPSANSLHTFVWVAEDPDAAWQEIAPHAMHETNAYGKWMAESDMNEAGTTYVQFDDPDALRASGQYPIFTPDELIERARGMGPMDAVMFHPLMGGIEPDVSWRCLRLFEEKVLPALR